MTNSHLQEKIEFWRLNKPIDMSDVLLEISCYEWNWCQKLSELFMPFMLVRRDLENVYDTYQRVSKCSGTAASKRYGDASAKTIFVA